MSYANSGPPLAGGCGPRSSSNCIFFFLCNLLRGQKVAPKTAAVKRFRGRPRDYAKSDAFGTFEAIKRSPILTLVAATALNPKSFLPRDRLTHVNYCDSPSRAVRRRPTAADCNSPKARAALRRRRTASLRALKSHKNSPKTRKITKKARKLLYDTIICTTFGQAIRRNAT